MKTIVLGPPGTGKTTTLLNLLEDYLKKTDPKAELTIAGSYRRRNAESGDIDVLLQLSVRFLAVCVKAGSAVLLAGH